jgi:pimeloyl-ACP methyl ester carboxylesterase
MNEQIAIFGRAHRLVGVTTVPDGPSSADPPGVILLNAGLIHRIGPRRLHVTIARLLASRGFAVLRFDLSGTGDSSVRRDDLPAVEGVVSDAREAMDHLAESRGVRKFYLVGICSGAMISYMTARHDERVQGVVLVDPSDFGRSLESRPVAADKTYARHYWRSILSRGLSMGRLKRILTGKSDYGYAFRALGAGLRSLVAGKSGDGGPLVAELRSMLQRKLELSLVYTEKGDSLDFYRAVLAPSLGEPPSDPSLLMRVIPGTDHNFIGLDSQQALLAAVEDWAEKNSPPGSGR